MALNLPIHRLEQYSLRYPNQVLLLKVQTAIAEDEILIFKGFSSSLVQATDFDPDVPLIAEGDNILQIDRLVSPYQGENSEYLEKNISWQEMESRLTAIGL